MTMTQEEANKLLMKAADSGDIAKVQAALDAGADIHARDRFGHTALIWAASNGHIETCRLLLEKGTDIHAVNIHGDNALIRAAGNGRTEICRLLLEKGADIHAVDKDDKTALILAAHNCHTKTCKFLLRQGAAMPMIFPKGKEHLAERLTKYLSEMKTSAQKAFPTGHKPTHEACLTSEGKPTDAVLDACATDQFAALIAAPLLHTKNPDDRKLFLDIYKALPKHWQNEEAALYLQARRDMQQTKTPSPPGRGLG
jgi:ankyrin repeat protein